MKNIKKDINKNYLNAGKVITHSLPNIDSQEEKSLLKLLKTGFLSEGSEVAAFEKEMADYIGIKFAMAVSSGTAALHCALLALRIGAGDEVIIPNYVCRSVLNAVQYVQARPVLCDVDRRTFNMTADCVQEKVTRRTKAIIVAHMFGCPAALAKMKKIGIPLIEDCAQSIGAEYEGKRIGSTGDIAIFSFEGTKPMTTGEGGMIVTASGRLYKKLMRLKEPYKNDQSPKYTYRMSSLQAAVGRVQLRKLSKFISRRQKIAKQYLRAFQNIGFGLPFIPVNSKHIFYRFMITLRDKEPEDFMRLCRAKGVLVKRPVKPYVLNQYLGCSFRLFPNTKFIMEHCVSVPIYPSLSNNQVRYVIGTVKNSYQGLLKK